MLRGRVCCLLGLNKAYRAYRVLGFGQNISVQDAEASLNQRGGLNKLTYVVGFLGFLTRTVLGCTHSASLEWYDRRNT